MTRSRFTTMAAATAFAALVGGIGLYAQTPPAAEPGGQQARRFGGPHRGGPGHLPGLRGPGGPMGVMPLRQLDLTEAQREQVRGIMETHRQELQATGERVRAAAKAQHDAVTAVPFDESAVRAKAAELAAAQTDAAVLHGRLHAQVYGVLTPEQQAKAAELKAQREQRLQERMKRMQERRQQRQGGAATPPAGL